MLSSVFNEGTKKEFDTIKPHHFLDFLYDLAVCDRHDEENLSGNNNALLSRKFSDGEMKKIKFTPFVDDVCRPCNKLIDGVRCIDYFDDETTLNYGFRYKNDFNYQLDLKLNRALPKIFCFDKTQNMFDVLTALEKNLTSEIIDLYLWKRSNRVENTFKGINKAKVFYSK